MTGCNGYIGRHLRPILAMRGYTIVGLDRRDSPEAPDEFYLGDLNDADTVGRAADGVELVIHLAAAKDDWGISEAEYYRDNVDATRTLLEVGKSADIQDWVFYSTVSVYAPSDEVADESASHEPINAYGRSKAAAEALFDDFARQQPSAQVMIIRPSVVFGPGHPKSTNVFRLIDSIDRGRFRQVGGRSVIKATSYIENVVAATAFLLDHRRIGVSDYIYTDLPLLTTRELVGEICQRLGRTPPRFHLPLALALALPIGAAGSAAAKLTKRNVPITWSRIKKFNTGTAFTASKLRSLGFVQPVSIPDALDRTVDWQRGTGG